MMDTNELIHRRLASWKEHLLDTSKRNRLLYFSPSLTSTVSLVEPEIDTIWTRLVVKNKVQSFFALEAEEELYDEAESEEEDTPPIPPRPLKMDELRTEPTGSRLTRTLYHLRQKSNLSLQEQGVATLFVAFGFLKWQESAAPGSDIFSPLILAPVTLLRESIHTSYKLKLWEEDILLNPALVSKLNSEARVTLPPLPALDDLTLAEYFREVEGAIASRTSWSVWEAAYMGLFSFHKIAMYNDLREHEARALGHPLVRALAGDTESVPLPPADLPAGRALDLISPDDTWQVVDADSTQQEAIQAARRGCSFVLQGPPGTGKSQTITNIIAECLAVGKKVLFVSEKMAALEVVHSRLCQSGLQEFCLEAHSHKANKREVIQELGRTLSAVHKPAALNRDAGHDLMQIRQTLNDYVRELHAVRPPADLTTFAVQGKLALLEATPDLEFPFLNPSAVPPAQRAEIDVLLDELVRLHATVVSQETHPWHGVALQQWTLQGQTEIRTHFTGAKRSLGELQEKLQALMAACAVRRFTSLTGAQRIVELATLLIATPRPPTHWFQSREMTPLMERAKELKTRFDDLHARSAALSANYTDALRSLPQVELSQQLTTAHETLWSRVVTGGKKPGDVVVAQRNPLGAHLDQVLELLDELDRDTSALAQTLGVEAPGTLTDAVGLHALATLVLQNLRPQRHWFADGRLPMLQMSVAEASNTVTLLRSEREQLTGYGYDIDRLLALDHGPLAERFAGAYAGPLRILKPGFRRDTKLLLSVKNPQASPAKLSPEEAVRDLKLAASVVQRQAWLDTHAEEHRHDFGHYYQGLETDWAAVKRALEWCGQILDSRGIRDVPSSLVDLLVEGGVGFELATEHHQSLHHHLSALQAELTALNKIVGLGTLPFTPLPLQQAKLAELRSWITTLQTDIEGFLAAYDRVVACVKSPPSNSTIATPTVAEVVHALQEARVIGEQEILIEAESATLQATFGHLFTGLATRWENVLQALDWTGRVLSWFGTNEPPPDFIRLATAADADLSVVADLLTQTQAVYQEARAEVSFAHTLFSQIEVAGRPAEHSELDDLTVWFSLRLDNLAALQDWLALQRLQAACETAGLEPFFTAVSQHKPGVSAIKSIFYKRFWTLWIDEVFREVPTLGSFHGDVHEAAIGRFRLADTDLLNMNRQRLCERLWQDKPGAGLGVMRSGEISILQRQVVRKARHKPLRQLFYEIPNLLQALKPCILMSPLSVAQFLHPERLEFDVVIFDEASQICSEDAVGAIMRGKQLIVVGDRKQLPPTRFFAATAGLDSEDEDAEDASGEVYESILDECSTIGLADKMLLWHYRSRNEDLIAFSNHHFYESNLVTFPGPNVPAAASSAGNAATLNNAPPTGILGASRGVEFEYAGGTYIRGKGRDARTNPVEARRIAELVIDHYSHSSHQTLGVIAFNEAQATAIDIQIGKLRYNRPDLDKFFSESAQEAFFVKNLENVQGDERDVIFFSIGYGPDQDGRVSMNFGPLNRAGGERRLNVAVTRARHRVRIVSSIEPAQIDPARTSARGPALLRAYLEFAKMGAVALPRTNADTAGLEAEELQTAIAAALEGRGVPVHRRVGYSELRLDLAIPDNANPERYLLGIQCDGVNYAATPTARDRDRLRDQVLSGLGWHILHIWSPDWIRNPEQQLQRIMEALGAARNANLTINRATNSAIVNAGVGIANYSTAVWPTPPGSPAGSVTSNPLDPNTVDVNGAAPTTVILQAGSNGATTTAHLGREPRDTLHISSLGQQETSLLTDPDADATGEADEAMKSHEASRSDVGTGTEVGATTGEPSNVNDRLPDGVVEYCELELLPLGAPEDFYQSLDTQPAVIMQLLVQVVEYEGPIHLSEATRRVVAGWGMGRAGSRLVRSIKDLARRAQSQNRLVIRGDFLWSVDVDHPVVRVSASGATARPIDNICLEEIGEAAMVCVRDAIGMERDDLIVATARLLGYKQTGANVRSRITEAVDMFLKQDRLQERGNSISLRDK